MLQLVDTIFSSGQVTNKAHKTLKDYETLQWPDPAPQAMLLARIDARSLRPGMCCGSKLHQQDSKS